MLSCKYLPSNEGIRNSSRETGSTVSGGIPNVFIARKAFAT